MRKEFLFFVALTLSAGLWAKGVKYIDADGREKTTSIAGWIDNSSTSLEAGWYVVTGEDVQTGTLVCQGDVHLILADGTKLTATGKGDSYCTPGIQVSGKGNSLTIYAQSTGDQMGQLIAKGGKWAAGIGGEKGAEGNNITINGGKVTATGYTAAGIGGGYGGNGSNITINGGIVIATGGGLGAGIGGGDRGKGSYITINGGTITTKGGDYATGIGGGDKGNGSNITINGGTITANGGTNAVAIGNGYQATTASSNIFVATKCTLKAGTSTSLTDDNIVAHTSTADIASILVGKRYAAVVGPTCIPTLYIDENGVLRNMGAYAVADSSSQVTWGAEGETVWYVVNADVRLAQGAVCHGDVRLILADDAQLTAVGWLDESTYMGYAGIQVVGEDNSLTIYAQAAQSGQLIATGEYAAAGIGGKSSEAGSDITINGGVITATGGRLGSGIGGGAYGTGSTNIIINGGTVTAIGGDYAAGIGGGYGYFASDVYISDAHVLYAGASETLTDDDIVTHSSAQDLGETLMGKQYVKMEGLATPYERRVTIGQWATICLPYAATSFEGATFYKINYCDGANKLYVEEVETLEAGMPYIFEATAEMVTINHDATTPVAYGEEQTERGLHGSVARKMIISDGNQAAISGGAVIIAEKGAKVTVPACRAYLDMSEVPTTEQPHKAPLRAMGVPRQTPTGVEQFTDSPTPRCTKYIKNGQLIIVRDGKMYNALGL